MKLRCVVERITYQNPENGYSVLRVKVKGYDDLVTLIGNLLEVPVGSVLLCEGEWKVGRKYGVSTAYAAKIYREYGKESIDKVKENPYRPADDIRGIGFVESVNLEDRMLSVKFDGRGVEYEASELDEVTLAYATTIHKAQGSEYPIVVIPILMTHFVMLQRNLIYTGITRAKKIRTDKSLYVCLILRHHNYLIRIACVVITTYSSNNRITPAAGLYVTCPMPFQMVFQVKFRITYQSDW